jgi:hypothetical protein
MGPLPEDERRTREDRGLHVAPIGRRPKRSMVPAFRGQAQAGTHERCGESQGGFFIGVAQKLLFTYNLPAINGGIMNTESHAHKPQKQRVSLSLEIKGGVSIRVKCNHSVQHILAAANFTRQSGQLEAKNPTSPSGEIQTNEISYVSGAIIMSVCFLEAVINELLIDVTEEQPNYTRTLSKDSLARLASFAKIGASKMSALDKYDMVLLLSYQQSFDHGKKPYQDAAFVVKLRNSLVHYEPEWTTVSSDCEPVDIQKYESMLKGKFSLNPWLVGMSCTFFPQKCMSYGCAKWAVNSVLDFADEFFKRIDLIPIYSYSRQELRQL